MHVYYTVTTFAASCLRRRFCLNVGLSTDILRVPKLIRETVRSFRLLRVIARICRGIHLIPAAFFAQISDQIL
jgi:hypothetical protein